MFMTLVSLFMQMYETSSDIIQNPYYSVNKKGS